MAPFQSSIMRLGSWLTALFLAFGQLSARDISVAASDLLPEPFIQRILTEGRNAGLDLRVEASGSVRAWDAFDEDRADIILVAQADAPQVDDGVNSTPYAFQVTVVAVSASNPVASIHFRQLREIFGQGGRADLWGRYVDEEERAWRSRPIQPHAVRQESHLGFEIFSQQVLTGLEPRSHVRFHGSQFAAINRLRTDPGGIGLLLSPSVGSNLRILPVAVSPEHTAYEPTPENVLSGDYVLSLPFYLFWKDTAASRDEVAKVLSILFSDRVVGELEQQGWMLLPESERTPFRD